MYTKTDKLLDKITDLHFDLANKLKVKHNIDLNKSNILDLTYIVIDNDLLTKEDINIIYLSIEQTLLRKYPKADIKALQQIMTSIMFCIAKIETEAVKDELFEIAYNASKLLPLLENLFNDISSPNFDINNFIVKKA